MARWKMEAKAAAALCVISASFGVTTEAEAEVKFRYSGYVREGISVNLNDPIETGKNDQFDLSMLRTTVRLNGSADFGNFSIAGVGRWSREAQTNYLDRLDDLVPGGASNKELYKDNGLRELYGSFSVGRRVKVRLGKQQVVWGETDFFRAMDIIHGYDQRWRSFLEPENEELRKPLILANVRIRVPELSGSLQLIYRPGWDNEEDVGTDVDFAGGRWAGQPLKGVDAHSQVGPGVPFNYEHSKGDYKDDSYGFRWEGTLNEIAYSLNYYRGPDNQAPTINPGAGVGGTSYGDAPTNGFAEFIFPEVDTFGVTLNAYNGFLDTIFRGEFAYVPDQPYNYGTSGPLPGFGGVIEKDTLRSMVGFDKQVNLGGLLGTVRPSLWTMQLFDTWITDFKASDDIADLYVFNYAKKEHSTMLTNLLVMNYRYDTINPSLAIIYDLSHRDTILVPGLDLVFGDHWRVHMEADLFLTDGGNGAGGVNSAHLLGTLENNDQFYARITYQF